MDLEKILTQLLIAFFTGIFFLFASRVKRKIESRYRKLNDKINHSKERIRDLSEKQAVLCKKVMCEITNRHHRSIIAASLKQTLEEEMNKLETLKDSIKIVQQIPDLKPSVQQFDKDFFPDFDNGSVFDLSSKEARRNKEKKLMARGDDIRLQTKLCKAWRSPSRNLVKRSNDSIRKNRKKNWINSNFRRIKNGHFYPTKTNLSPANMDAYDYNTHVVTLRENITKNTGLIPDKIIYKEPLSDNDSVGKLSSLGNITDETVNYLNQTPSFHSSAVHTENQPKVCKGQANIQNFDDSWPYRLSENGTIIDAKRSNPENIAYNSLNDQNTVANSVLLEVANQKEQIVKMNQKRYFQFDFIYSNEKATVAKVAVEHKNNKNYISQCGSEKSFQVVDLKMFQISSKKHANSSNILMRYIFKISLKMDKKKLILKCILSCYRKGKRIYEQLGYRTKQKSQSNKKNNNKLSSITVSSCCKVKSKHISLESKPMSKRHSLYTNTSKFLTDGRKNKSGDSLERSLAEGDMALVPVINKNTILMMDDKDIFEPNIVLEPQSFARELDRSILKQCVGLTNDSLKDYTNVFSFSNIPQLSHHQLSSIKEEDNTSFFEELNKMDCSMAHLKRENALDINNEEVIEQLHKSESIECITPVGKGFNIEINWDCIKTENNLQTYTSFQPLQFLELQHLNWLAGLNSCISTKNNRHNSYSQGPSGLTCIFELKSYVDPMYLPNIFLNRFNTAVKSEEESASELRISQNETLPLIKSCDIISDVTMNKNEDKSVVKYNEPRNDVERMINESEAENSLAVKEAIFKNNESDDLSITSQNTSSSVIILEGAMFCSTDNSSTISWGDNRSTTDLSDDELSAFSN